MLISPTPGVEPVGRTRLSEREGDSTAREGPAPPRENATRVLDDENCTPNMFHIICLIMFMLNQLL